MKKKNYQEPATAVIELRHRSNLLAGNSQRNVRTRGTINDWEEGDETNEDIYF